MEEMSKIDTGLVDMNYNIIYVGDKVSLFGRIGEVCTACGAYGVGIKGTIGLDWDKIEEQVKPIAGYNRTPHFLYNDNFVSFLELITNFDINGEPDVCDVVEVIGLQERG